MKLLSVCLLIASAFAEPPVNSYLPPQNGLSAPSASYGAPRFGQRQTQALIGRPKNNFSRRPSTEYGVPSRKPQQEYLPPQNQPSTQYGTPNQGIDRMQLAGLSQEYGVPGTR
ncbi:unnamed protein product [Leptidea sinapis]|uniref:Uncharacterized protein n=1 Tax=Leptidea sinapis TaxID=189913 RepID=A0A5E4R514_9NEOP|nr:unnamed protein product [Leptidea sinapis]